MSHIAKPNVWIDFDNAATTQLTYALTTDPAPLTVSVPKQPPTLASLEFVVTNQTANPIAVTSITFTLQVGDDASDVTPSTGGILTAVSDPTTWTVTSPSGIITSGQAPYVLGPVAGASATLAAGASVIVQIYEMQTGASPGTSTIGIKEMAGGTPAFTSASVTTFPAGFYLNGLVATVLQGSALVPVAQVANPSPVTLVWNSSVADTAAVSILYSSATLGHAAPHRASSAPGPRCR